MAETRVASSFEEFVEVCTGEGIRVAGLQQVDEVRPVLHDQGVTVAPVRRTTLVGYRRGLLVRAVVEDPPPDLARRLQALGFQTRTSRQDIG